MHLDRVAVVAAIVIGWSSPGPALAADPAVRAVPAVPVYGPGTVACTVSDPRIAESSGLVVDGSRLLTVNDGGDSLQVFVLDASCQVTSVVSASIDPYDVEDLARAADGTLWLADVGDNGLDRSTVAMEALRKDGQAVLFRFSYPDGPHDAEALLLDSAGRPFIVTKDPIGRAGIYTPAAPPSPSAPTALDRVGDFRLTPTGSPGGPIGAIGQVTVTGAAVSPDGALVAVRTYTDAYVYAVPDGDVVAALAGTPVRVRLPASPQGEAIAFGANGRDLVVTSEGSPFPVTVLPAVPAAVATSGPAGAETRSSPGASRDSASGNSTATDLLVAGVLAAVIVGVLGLRRRSE